MALPRALAATQRAAQVARALGLEIVACEGGQRLVGSGYHRDDPAVNALFDAANRDPRMGALYRRHLDEWTAATGGGLFVHHASAALTAGLHDRRRLLREPAHALAHRGERRLHVPARSIGNPFTAADDVYVDGKIITAESYDSAAQSGRVLADRIGR